jgi:hypothetical protein
MASSIGSTTLVTALFKDAAGVERAYHGALLRGYSQDDINLVLSEETRRRCFNAAQVEADVANKAAKSTEMTADKEHAAARRLGGPVGGTAATFATAAVAIGTATLLPGLVLAGPIAVALAAAAAVGTVGGLIGALINWGLPRSRVEEYESQIRQGGILIGVKARSDADTAFLKAEWQAAGGTLIHA